MRNKIHAIAIAILMLAISFSGCIDRPAVWGKPGDARKEFLGSSYEKIIIEVDYDSNTKPDDAALSLLRQRLTDAGVCGKDIEIKISDKLTDSKASYSIQEIRAIQDKYRSHHNQFVHFGDGAFYAYVLYLDGEYADNKNVIGLAYSADSFVIFQSNIKKNVNQFGIPPTAQDVEKSVLIHEFGHLLGLVSRGQDSLYKYKEDARHEHHCENSQCVMYYAVDTTDVIGAFLNKGTPTDFCESCRQEMNAYR